MVNNHWYRTAYINYSKEQLEIFVDKGFDILGQDVVIELINFNRFNKIKITTKSKVKYCYNCIANKFIKLFVKNKLIKNTKALVGEK